MRRFASARLVLIIAILGAVFLAGSAGAQTVQLKPETLAGKYEGAASTPDGDMPVKAELRIEKGTLLGAIDTHLGPIAITGAKITGNQVVFNIDMSGAPGTMTTTFKEKEGVLEGTWSLGENSGNCKLTRINEKPAAADSPAKASADLISGVWDGVVGSGEMSRNFTLTVKLDGEKVSGEIASDEGALPLSSGTWKEGALTVAFDYPGMGAFTMVGAIKDDKLIGTLDAGGQMQMPFAAVKRANK